MKLITNVRSIINYQTFIVIFLSGISTVLCSYYKISIDFPTTIIGIAIVFPIVFSIGGAYNRREAALKSYSTLKAHGRALYFVSRDWLPEQNIDSQNAMRVVIRECLQNIKNLFSYGNNHREPDESAVNLSFSKLSELVNGMRKVGLPGGEASRANQYISKMIEAYEGMKHIYQYRTPITLRTYSKVFIFVIPVIFGPYFVHIAEQFSIAIQLIMPVLFSVVLVSLDNIQDHLENPFDQIGADDVKINPEKFEKGLLIK